MSNSESLPKPCVRVRMAQSTIEGDIITIDLIVPFACDEQMGIIKQAI
jgi:hypothetical protein